MSILVIPSQNQKILPGVRVRDADNNFYFISCEADLRAVNPRETGKLTVPSILLLIVT
jgi:hypothetical protein